mgnify:CR=1 FL=1
MDNSSLKHCNLASDLSVCFARQNLVAMGWQVGQTGKENWEEVPSGLLWVSGIQSAFVVIVSELCLYSQIVRQKWKQLCNSQAYHQRTNS